MKAIDPRDKIFAMMVFGNETHEMESLPSEVRPNYKKNVLQVYADFTRWWILHHKSLRILSAVHTLGGRSWVNISGPRGSNTDFDLSQWPSWMLWYEGFSQWMHGTLALHDQCEYHASEEREVDHDLLKPRFEKRQGGHHHLPGTLPVLSTPSPFPTSARGFHQALRPKRYHRDSELFQHQEVGGGAHRYGQP
jgi:hypothetical protein